jgi:ABC-2 type transport system permease protein
MFAPSSFFWLFGQEARIMWRGSLLVRSRRYVLIPVLLVALVFQGGALVLSALIVRQTLPLPELILIANLNLFFFSFLMLSRAMSAAVDVLYSRGDVDFLLASPMPPGRVLAVRMIGVGAAVAAPWVLLGGALANALALRGVFWALAIYPMLAALGLLASSLAFVIVVVLVARLGPGRARGIAHLLALATGVLIFALGQAPRFISPARMSAFWHLMMPEGAASGLSWLPGRAMLGQPGPLLGFLLFTAAVFALVWRGLDGKFASGAIGAAAFRAGRAGGTAGRGRRFRGEPFAAAAIKNLRLLARFPGLATQTVYRSLTLVPVLMILAGRVRIGGGPEVIAPLLVFLAGQLGLFFVSVITVGNQAADLAASAPVTPAAMRRAALVASAYAAMLVLAVPLLLVMLRRDVLLPPLLIGIAGVLVCNLALGIRYPIPLARAQFGKSQTGTMLGLLLGVSVSSVWAFAAWVAVAPHPFAWLVHR